jgi:hypothetical protein
MNASSDGSIRLALGVLCLIVGVIVDSIGVAALGVVVLLTGLYARSKQH